MPEPVMTRKKILVVDDEPDIVTALKAFLEESGYEVLTASNGSEALKISRKEKPQLIILDVMMPEMSGLQFVEALRFARMDTGFVPIIVISARASMGDFFSASDIVQFLSKPFDMETLLKTIKTTIGEPLQETKSPKTEEAPKPWTNILKKRFYQEENDEGTFPDFPDAEVKDRKTPVLARVIVLGVEETLLHKIKKFLEALNCDVREAMDEVEALGMAREIPPDAVLCQYWADQEILDAVQIQKTLLAEVPHVITAVFCDISLMKDTTRKFGTDHILAYENQNDLFKQISTFIGIHFKGAK